MKLKSLHINGFKSFAKKSNLEFSSPVTCIVGPNGSGKSNVVEAFRFVLGEQSMKSMRGKSGSDLIFKGSKELSKLSRAEVSIVFDNKKRTFKLKGDGETNLDVDFDEIIISRDVFADGASVYKVNGTEVRLKDIHELLSSVHIGASGHHIISQGGADRILNANPTERRNMIEDALGLKIYQMRMKETERKLEKTFENMKEIDLLKREIAPHLRFLKKQVEKIEKTKMLSDELAVAYKNYLVNEEHFIQSQEKVFLKDRNELLSAIKEIDAKLSTSSGESEPPLDHVRLKQIQTSQETIRETRILKDELARAIGKLEAMIELEHNKKTIPQEHKSEMVVRVAREDIEALLRDLSVYIDSALKQNALEGVRAQLSRIKSSIVDFSSRVLKAQNKQEEIRIDHALINRLTKEKEEIIAKSETCNTTIISSEQEIEKLNRELEDAKRSYYEGERVAFELKNEKEKLLGRLEMATSQIDRISERKNMFEENVREAVTLVGEHILKFKNTEFASAELVTKESQDELHKTIERLKIKLEDSGLLGGEDIMREYKETSEREAFLTRELIDLEESIASLKTLIHDLKDTLDREFKQGIEKINTQFQEFFALMFGGGSAFLSLLVQKPRKKKTSDDDEDEELDELLLDEDGTKNFEQGIDINVSLPQKKVTQLGALSGGERSLTSIALLFAMTQVNPPPFLVLDETDAALDEANSRRYGDMIERLAKYSGLIVVTHNRETMSRADLLYGVTIGSDGGSKLLSIKFNEAQEYVK